MTILPVLIVDGFGGAVSFTTVLLLVVSMKVIVKTRELLTQSKLHTQTCCTTDYLIPGRSK